MSISNVGCSMNTWSEYFLAWLVSIGISLLEGLSLFQSSSRPNLLWSTTFNHQCNTYWELLGVTCQSWKFIFCLVHKLKLCCFLVVCSLGYVEQFGKRWYNMVLVSWSCVGCALSDFSPSSRTFIFFLNTLCPKLLNSIATSNKNVRMGQFIWLQSWCGSPTYRAF